MAIRSLIGVSLGPYQILALIGKGGVGEVYRAHDESLKRTVAIKVLSGSLLDTDAARQFEREARMLSARNHPHILTVYHTGEWEGHLYLVMEYAEGGTLTDWAQGNRSWRQTASLLVEVADGLAAAHDAGILHRDVKPANILVTKDGYAKLADFGLARPIDRATADTSDALTIESGIVKGTPYYMSPEQIQGQDMDARSDIFSFGVVLYELLAGTRPFAGPTFEQLRDAILNRTPPSLSGDIPEPLQTIVEKSLQKDSAERYQTMRDMVVDLRRVIRVGPESSRTLVTSATAIPVVPVTPVWKKCLVDAASLALIAVIVVLGRAYMSSSAIGEQLKSTEYAVLQQALIGDSNARQWDENDPRLPIVVDIAPIRSDRTQPTDRTKLDALVGALRDMHAAAIGIDVDFSPDDAGNFVTTDDPRLLAKWQEYGNVRVGVFRRQGDLPHRWLGHADFRPLAAGLLLPQSDPSFAYQFIAAEKPGAGAAVPARSDESLLQMPAALFEIVNPGSRRGLVENPRLRRSDVDNRVVLGEFPVDYTFLQRIQKIPYREPRDLDLWSKRIARRVVLIGDTGDVEDSRCTQARSEVVSGVFIHASALATLNRGILRQLDGRAKVAYNAGICLLALLVIWGFRLIEPRVAPVAHLDQRALRVLSFAVAAFAVFVAGVLAMRVNRIFWPESLWLAGWLFIVPYLHDIWRGVRALVWTGAPTRGVSHAH